jgi:hypothetical protein
MSVNRDFYVAVDVKIHRCNRLLVPETGRKSRVAGSGFFVFRYDAPGIFKINVEKELWFKE